MVCKNPVAGARFFYFMIETFITDVLGVGSDHRGFYGDTKAFYGTVEQQGRLTLHLHMLLWIKGCLNPQEMREKILKSDSEWNQKIIDWLESCHSGEFLTGTQEEVADKTSENMKNTNYTDPTQTLPLHPPELCEIDHIGVNGNNAEKPTDCMPCSKWLSWWTCAINTIDDLLLKSNVHSCNHNMNKNGSRKNNTSSGCKDNKWGRCKARFPRSLFTKSTIDNLTGAINIKKLEPWLNTFTPIVTYLFRCNTDVTSLSSETAIKAVVIYVSDYITKSSLKTRSLPCPCDSCRIPVDSGGIKFGRGHCQYCHSGDQLFRRN
jgi:Helitron helicase-like domain at N-terminus